MSVRELQKKSAKGKKKRKDYVLSVLEEKKRSVEESKS